MKRWVLHSLKGSLVLGSFYTYFSRSRQSRRRLKCKITNQFYEVSPSFLRVCALCHKWFVKKIFLKSQERRKKSQNLFFCTKVGKFSLLCKFRFTDALFFQGIENWFVALGSHLLDLPQKRLLHVSYFVTLRDTQRLQSLVKKVEGWRGHRLIWWIHRVH